MLNIIHDPRKQPSSYSPEIALSKLQATDKALMQILAFEKDIPSFFRKHGYSLLVNMRKSGDVNSTNDLTTACAKLWWLHSPAENAVHFQLAIRSNINSYFRRTYSEQPTGLVAKAADAFMAALENEPDKSVYTIVGEWYDRYKHKMRKGSVHKNTLKQLFEMALSTRQTAPVIDMTIQNSLLAKLEEFRLAHPGLATTRYPATIYESNRNSAERERFYQQQASHKAFMSMLTDAEHVVLNKLSQMHQWTRAREGAARLHHFVLTALYDKENKMASWKAVDYFNPSPEQMAYMEQCCQQYSNAILRIHGLGCLMDTSKYVQESRPDVPLLSGILNTILTTGESLDAYTVGSITLRAPDFLKIAENLDEPFRTNLIGGINLLSQNETFNVIETVKLFCIKQAIPEVEDVTLMLDKL